MPGYQRKHEWTDTNDVDPDRRGRLWCAYEVPTADETCPINNPVQPGSGVKVLSEVDVAASGNQGLPLVRHYRSQWPEGLTDGLAPRSGWRLPWQAQLSRPQFGRTTQWAKQAVPAVIWVARPSGRVELFHSKAGGPWQGAGGRHALTDLGASATPERWSLTDADTGHTEYYDPAGRLSRVVERTGLTTTVQRDSTGRLLSVTHSSGRQWVFAYSGSAISTATGPGGVQVHYTHSGGNLTQVRVGASTGPAWRYHYEDRTYPRALTGITDPSGQRMATYSYDYSSGKVARTEGANGQDAYSYHFTTDAQGRPVCQVSDPSGQTETLQFADANHARRLSGTLSNTGQGTSQSYDAQGRLQRQLTANGEVVFYTRNARGQETQRATFRAPYLAHTTPPPLGQAVAVVSTQWHATLNLPTQVAEPGKLTRYSHNGQGNVTLQQWWSTADATGAQGFAATTTSPEQSRQTQYDTAQRPVRITQRSNGVVQQDWAYTYNSSGQLASVQDLLGGETASVGLHALGMPAQVTSSSGAAATFNWNAQGQLQSASHAGYSLSFQYDSRQWLSGIDLGGGRTIAISYDAQGQISQVQDNTGLANQPTEQAQGTQRLRRQALPLFLNPALTGGMAAAMPGAGGAGTGGSGASAVSPWMRQAQCEVCNPLASTSVSPVVLQQGLQQNVVWAVLTASTVVDVTQGLLNELLTYRASTQLANNMQCRTDAYYQEKPDGPCTEPHHIVPFADRREFIRADADAARAILAEVGIDLNSAANGVWVECNRHRRMHNGEYYRALRAVLEAATPRNRDKVADALNIVRTGILSKTFPGTAF